ncbi:HAD family hydrolase [Granulicoccus sp. GXG6511]|uniref:HAD family hydrolase n=1 Tax=Granulicoccus sp. GXG6511 TaxID=3381351 RepID=UPI003D7E5187
MATFEAFVFDMDGVLTDTESLWDEVRRGLAADAGLAWPEEATDAMMGMSTPEWSAYLVDTVGLPGPPERAATEVIDAMAARYHEQLPTLPGAVAAVRRIAGIMPIGLASSSPRRLIDAVLAELELVDLFTATVSTEEVERGKPAPDGYLRACALLGVDPARCAAVEDSSNGLRAAHAAGMTVIAVPHPWHRPAEDALALAAAVLESLDELDESLLVRLAEGRA